MIRTHARLVLLALGMSVLALSGCRSSNPPTVVAPPESTSTAQPAPTPLAEMTLTLNKIADGFDQPLFLTVADDGSERVFVVEKTGRIWIMRGGARDPQPFLDLSKKVSTGAEQGLLGLAFSPSFAQDRVFWVDYTDTAGDTVISSFLAAGDVADTTSERVYFKIDQPFANHNGGMLAFGPDGYLYVGMGDGGSGGDPNGNAQGLDTLLGKLLRIDARYDATVAGSTPYGIPGDNPFVDVSGARPEIWAHGLRNPWRFSFDRKTGDLWIGDVGQNMWEEIDRQLATSRGGENYGWNIYEGAHTYPGGEPAPKDAGVYVMPIVEYDHSAGNSVTGGYVYRGTAFPALDGVYFYADFGSGRIWGLRITDDGYENAELADTELSIASFGQDDAGELYVIDLNGGIYQLGVE